jgi:hypothetical protein
LPPLPSIVSLPRPPFSVSAPAPPAIVSLPGPPSIRVGMALVNAPFVSSMRTRSLPPRALMLMLSIAARGKRKSADPLSPTST